ncbi:hypothetical protein OSTOST_07220, partial [Ostertagia ostertagi]
VAEVLLNPLGEDDDDFECNYILDRNLQLTHILNMQLLNSFFEVGLNVVDKAYDTFPEMVRDDFWEDSLPEPLYTAESAQRPINPQVGSCVDMYVGLNVVDKAYDTFPEMVRDDFWEDSLPEPLYTAESAQRPINPQVGSCVDMSTHEEPFMIHPRRRTISRASHWDGEVENDDMVPVIGNDKPRDNSHSSSSSLDRFDESFHNKVNPPGLYPQNGSSKFSRSVPDGMKMAFDETGPKSPRSPPPGGVAWFVDELGRDLQKKRPEKRAHIRRRFNEQQSKWQQFQNRTAYPRALAGCPAFRLREGRENGIESESRGEKSFRRPKRKPTLKQISSIFRFIGSEAANTCGLHDVTDCTADTVYITTVSTEKQSSKPAGRLIELLALL